MLIVARKIPFIYHKTPHQSINSGTSHHLFEYIRSNLYGKPRYQTSFKSYQYWIAQLTSSLLNPINAGGNCASRPSKPYQYWADGRIEFLQNPINTGLFNLSSTFKTLSILGKVEAEDPSKPYQYWGPFFGGILQNPINTGRTLVLTTFKTLSILGYVNPVKPSKPYQYWV